MAYPLLTRRLIIEPLRVADLGTFVGYRQDPEIARYQSWDTTFSREQAAELIASQTGVVMPEEDQWLQLAVRNLATGELLGDLALHRLPGENMTFEIGFTIASKHQGQGFAKEAAGRLIDYLSFEVGAVKIIATADVRNTASIALLTKLGFNKIPTKSWREMFKGEEVKVEYFEKVFSSIA